MNLSNCINLTDNLHSTNIDSFLMSKKFNEGPYRVTIEEWHGSNFRTDDKSCAV